MIPREIYNQKTGQWVGINTVEGKKIRKKKYNEAKKFAKHLPIPPNTTDPNEIKKYKKFLLKNIKAFRKESEMKDNK